MQTYLPELGLPAQFCPAVSDSWQKYKWTALQVYCGTIKHQRPLTPDMSRQGPISNRGNAALAIIVIFTDMIYVSTSVEYFFGPGEIEQEIKL